MGEIANWMLVLALAVVFLALLPLAVKAITITVNKGDDIKGVFLFVLMVILGASFVLIGAALVG